MCMKSPIIEKFSILGLHSDRDVHLKFDSPYKILVADNGAGKTTILNALFYCLTGKIDKLSKIEFNKIILKIKGKPEVTINNKDVNAAVRGYIDHPFFKKLSDKIGINTALELLDIAEDTNSLSAVRNHPSFLKYMRKASSSELEVLRMIDYISKKKGVAFELKQETLFESDFLSKKKLASCDFDLDVYYLPTYRRVEEDLVRLGYNANDFSDNNQLIHFGMTDVDKRFKLITENIKDSAVRWYSRISGRMLDELMNGISFDNDQLDKIKQPKTLRILLDRIGDSISVSRKDEILELVDSEKIYEDKYRALAYFLLNLVDIYDQQREKDSQIKKFVSVANKYLVGKELEYNESEVTIKVINNRNKKRKEVKLDKLSSGEKQLISILSKLYLEAEKPVAIIFDEPELSLSIDWQKSILPDLIASEKCGMLLAATHSPFIFDNNLDAYVEALKIEYKDVCND